LLINIVKRKCYQATLVQVKTRLVQVGIVSLVAVPLLWFVVSSAVADTRPNIVLLVADDAGYSDFSRFGGEAQTPAMDSLANIGKTLTNFHAMPNCSPSRAVFLTGIDNHMNGLGTMQGQLGNKNNPQVGTPGYRGYLNDHSVAISELLNDSGYYTYMTGKWHLGVEGYVDKQTVFFRGKWPIDQGFDRSYGILNGGGDHFGACERIEGTCTRFFENDEILIPMLDFAADYFSGSAHMDKAIEYIDADRKGSGERKPFFLYYADTMPHEPNQLPDDFVKQEYIDLYYQQGWDGIRAQRFQRMIDLGIIPSGLAFPDRVAKFPDWNDESDPKWDALMAKVQEVPYDVMWGISTVNDLKRTLAKKMALYTGMVEFFDSQVARLVAHLKGIGEYENTVFLYFSDNGGDPREWDWLDRNSMYHRGTNNTYDNIGKRGSFVSNGPQWAQAVNVPFYGAKATVAEGGLRSPMVVAYPGGNVEVASSSDALTTVADLAATVLDYANVKHPVGTGVKPDWDACTGTYKDATDICPMNGKSMRGLLEGGEQYLHLNEPIGYEIFGRAARDAEGNIIGDRPNKALFYEEEGQLWKILRLGDAGWGKGPNEPWKLYNLTLDPSESTDLGSAMPDKLAQLMEMYNEYEQNVGVIPQSAKKVTDVVPGTSVSHMLKVTNTSDSTETYTLSCRSDWPCVLLPEIGPVTLAPGESMEVGVVISVPVGVDGQTRTTQVSIARQNTPQMSNNQIFVTQAAKKSTSPAVGTVVISVDGQMPDRLAQLMAMYEVTDVVPGTNVSHLIEVTNTGVNIETYTLDCQSDWPCVFLPGTDTVTLAPGESVDVGLTIRVPSDAGGQRKMTLVSIARKGNPQASSNQTFVTQAAKSSENIAAKSEVSNGGGGSTSVGYLLLLIGGVFLRFRMIGQRNKLAL